VIVDERNDEAILLLAPNKTISCPLSKIETAEIIIDMRDEPSPAYRFEDLILHHGEWSASVTPWLKQHIRSLLATKDAARIYANSAMRAGQYGLAQNSGLSQSELQWLKMRAFSADGNWKSALAAALNLQRDRYPDRVEIIVKAILIDGLGQIDPRSSEAIAIREIPSGFLGAALAKALVMHLPLTNIPEAVADVHTLFPKLMGPATADWIAWLSRTSEAPHESLSETQNVYESAVFTSAISAPDEVSWNELLTLKQGFPTIVDDLIDATTVNIDMPASINSDSSQTLEDSALYLLARIRPNDLTDAQLSTVAHEWEIARRSYLADDDIALREMGDSTAADHYRALLSLRKGVISDDHKFRCNTELLNEIVKSVRSSHFNKVSLSDPTVWGTFHELIDEQTAAEDPRNAPKWHLRNAVAHIFQWDWDEAARSARYVLRESQDESARDEALNVLAFAHYQEGADDQSIQALGKALQDDYSANLQANMGIVAEHLDPTSAAEHLGRLAADAPSSELRLAAARRAYGIWNSSLPAWEPDSEAIALPTKLRDVFRKLANESTPLDDHCRTMRILASLDSTWLAQATNTDGSPHASTWEHKMYVAKAGDEPDKFLSTLTKAITTIPDSEWMRMERDAFVDELRGLVFEAIRDEADTIGPALYAWAAIKEGLPMAPVDEVIITSGAILSLLTKLEQEDHAPSDKLLKLLKKADNIWSDQLDADQQEHTKLVLDAAFDSYARVWGNACVAGYNQALDQVREIVEFLSTLSRIKWSEVHKVTRPIRRHLLEMAEEMGKAQAITRDGERKEWISELADKCRQLEARIVSLSNDKQGRLS
jgi:hypothetical protein